LYDQEGRHRAVAARQLGYKTIPVYTVETDKNYIKSDEESQDYKLPDGKEVIIKSHKNTLPKKVVWNTYKNLPDDKNIPVVFQTKKQYLKEYIKNQEAIHGYDFPKKQEQEYIKNELQDMSGISGRYTTRHNKYMEPRTVFFTDVKWDPKSFKQTAAHEVGHEIYERNKKIKHDWNSVNKHSSPTHYGKTDKDEDFADSYMLYKQGKLNDKKRKKIIKDGVSKNKKDLDKEIKKLEKEIDDQTIYAREHGYDYKQTDEYRSKMLMIGELLDKAFAVQKDLKSKNNIRFKDKPPQMDDSLWEQNKKTLNIITKKDYDMVPNQKWKMDTILEEDREVQRLDNMNAKYKDDKWRQEYNNELFNVLRSQGYSDSEILQYLEEKKK